MSGLTGGTPTPFTGEDSPLRRHPVSDEESDHGHHRLEETEDQRDPNTESGVDAREADADGRRKVRQAERYGDQDEAGHQLDLSQRGC